MYAINTPAGTLTINPVSASLDCRVQEKIVGTVALTMGDKKGQYLLSITNNPSGKQAGGWELTGGTSNPDQLLFVAMLYANDELVESLLAESEIYC